MEEIVEFPFTIRKELKGIKPIRRPWNEDECVEMATRLLDWPDVDYIPGHTKLTINIADVLYYSCRGIDSSRYPPKD